MSDPSRISQVLQRLIVDQIPTQVSPQTLQDYFKYFHRILSSRITSLDHDESSIKTLLTQKAFQIASENNIQKHTANSQALRLQELLQKFGQNKVLNHKAAMLYLLYKLSNSGKSNKNSVGTGALEALFKAKEEIKRPLKPQNSLNTNNTSPNTNMNNINSSLMDIEKPPPPMDRRLNETFAQQTIRKVTNKGNEAINLTENDILRDVLYVFHAIDGHYISFNDQENSYQIKAGVPLSEPLRSLINSLCEIGFLYRQLNAFLNKPQPGLIRQAFAISIKEELNEYFKLLALLENLRLESEENQTSLSLRKLALWSIEPLERLKWLNIISDGVNELIGGDVLSSLHSYKNQGSPVTLQLLNRILGNVYQPFLKYVHQWVYQGVINDPIGEFFVSELENETNLWANKYKINQSKIPSFLGKDLAEKIYLSGKTVNFLKKCCNFKEWTLHIEPFDAKDLTNLTKFQEWVYSCSNVINQKLLEVLFLNFSLEKHLDYLKKYLLMGQGDLIQNLMDNLTSELNKPASQIYRHQLMGALETAIRASNAQYHPGEFVNRLEIKLLGASTGDTGWDIFTLDYRVETPLNTIFHQNIMMKYLRIFNFLWRVKRVEFCLNNVWINQMKASQFLGKVPGVKKEFHRCHLLRNEMIHFIDNLFNYLMVEVIEATWDQFKEKLGGLKEMNELIELHENCIDKILEKALLKEKTEVIYKHLLKIFELIYRLKFTQDILLNKAQEEYSIYQRRVKEREMEELISEGKSFNDLPIKSGFTKENSEVLNSIAKDYMEALFSFQNLLKNEENLGNLRFLSFRLDFNEYYNNQPSNRFSNMSHFGGKGFLGIEPSGNTAEINKQNLKNLGQNLNFNQRMQIEKPPVEQQNQEPPKKSSIFEEMHRKKPSWLEENPNPTIGITGSGITSGNSNNFNTAANIGNKGNIGNIGPMSNMGNLGPIGNIMGNIGNMGNFGVKPQTENKGVMESIFRHDMEEEEDEFLQDGEDEDFEENEQENEFPEEHDFDPDKTNSFRKK